MRLLDVEARETVRGGGGKEAREACCAMLHAGKQAEAMREAEQLFSEGIFSQAELDCELVRISGAAQGRAVGRGGAEAMVAVAQTEGQDTMRASSPPGGAPGEAQVDCETASLQLLERYLKLSKPPDSAFDSIGTERTRLSDQGRELVWLECRACHFFQVIFFKKKSFKSFFLKKRDVL